VELRVVKKIHYKVGAPPVFMNARTQKRWKERKKNEEMNDVAKRKKKGFILPRQLKN
jgi:hypothetical protein